MGCNCKNRTVSKSVYNYTPRSSKPQTSISKPSKRVVRRPRREIK